MTGLVDLKRGGVIKLFCWGKFPGILPTKPDVFMFFFWFIEREIFPGLTGL